MTAPELSIGWHPDPRGRADERWWDGEYWTSSVRGGHPDAEARPARERAVDDAAADADADEAAIVVAAAHEPMEIVPRIDRSTPFARACATTAVVIALGAATLALLYVTSIVVIMVAIAAIVVAIVALIGRAHPSVAVLVAAIDSGALWVTLAAGPIAG